MTQQDGVVPSQRASSEPDSRMYGVPGVESYGTTGGYTETVDPYLGTLRSYPRWESGYSQPVAGHDYRHSDVGYATPSPESYQPSRTLYIDLSPASPTAYESVYAWGRVSVDPLDPAYDMFAPASQYVVAGAPEPYEYPTLPSSSGLPPEVVGYTAPTMALQTAVNTPVVSEAYAVAPQTDTGPTQAFVATSTDTLVMQRRNGPSRNDLQLGNRAVPPHDASRPDDAPRDPGFGDSPRPLRAHSVDDRMTWLGSAVAGFALAFLVYDRLLPFQGVVGFVIIYQVFRLALLGTVTALSHPRPVVIDRLATAAIRLGARLVFGALAWTIGFVVMRGFRTLHHVAFYTHTMAGVLPQSSVNQGGVLHAVVGSGIELAIATIITLPLGIMTAVYMTEVGGRLARIVRTVIEAMTSLPDLLAGLFIYTLLIIGLGFDRSGLAAALALAITMLPLVARSAEVALRVVPAGLRDAGVALGSTQWRTVLQVVLPTAAPGLATALIIAVARAVGETAPVLITSGASTFMNVNPVHNPMNSLPLFIYASLLSGEPNNIARGFGAAVLLLVVVVIFFVLIRLVASRSVKTR